MAGKFNWDALGIATSIACAIHCAALPLLISTIPLLQMTWITNEGFEYFMIFLAFVIGSYSLWHGYRRHHHSFIPILIFVGGIGLLVAKQLWHHLQFWFLPGAIVMIVIAHLLNYKACRVHNHAHSTDCNH